MASSRNNDELQELRFINLKLDNVTDTLVETNKSIKSIENELYNPHNGIFTRIKDNEKKYGYMKEWMEEHELRQEIFEKNLEKLSETAKINISNLTQTIDPIMDDYKLRKARQPWVQKIIIAIITIFLGLIIPMAWKILIHDSGEKEKVYIERPIRVVEPRINPDGTKNIKPSSVDKESKP